MSNSAFFTTLDLSKNTSLYNLSIKNTPFKANIPIGYNLSIGVVFYKEADIVKIVSVDEAQKQWGPTGKTTGANSDFDGASNTDIILSSSPAAQWCRAKGPDWYLPARNELITLYQVNGIINSSLLLMGKTQLTTKDYSSYWSSTELSESSSNSYAYRISFSSGYQSGDFKSYNYLVRAIRVL